MHSPLPAVGLHSGGSFTQRTTGLSGGASNHEVPAAEDYFAMILAKFKSEPGDTFTTIGDGSINDFCVTFIDRTETEISFEYVAKQSPFRVYTSSYRCLKLAGVRGSPRHRRVRRGGEPTRTNFRFWIFDFGLLLAGVRGSLHHRRVRQGGEST
jgi:hypothetical protein